MKKRVVVLVLCAVFLLGSSLGAVGAATSQEIKAILNYEIKMKINGAEFQPVGSDGKPMYPITYNGSTYLPVRAISQALSIAADYDGANKIVYLGEKGQIPLDLGGKGQIPLTSADYSHFGPSQLTVDKGMLLINNKQYQSGIIFTGKSGIDFFTGTVKPEGRYQKFGGVACLEDSDNSPSEVTIKIRDKDSFGMVLKELTVKNGESVSFEIEIPGLAKLYIQNEYKDRVPQETCPEKMGIYDPYFK